MKKQKTNFSPFLLVRFPTGELEKYPKQNAFQTENKGYYAKTLVINLVEDSFNNPRSSKNTRNIFIIPYIFWRQVGTFYTINTLGNPAWPPEHKGCWQHRDTMGQLGKASLLEIFCLWLYPTVGMMSGTVTFPNKTRNLFPWNVRLYKKKVQLTHKISSLFQHLPKENQACTKRKSEGGLQEKAQERPSTGIILLLQENTLPTGIFWQSKLGHFLKNVIEWRLLRSTFKAVDQKH